ncbi:MAG: thioredoxin family protein [Comamonadaceae bacterium]|jgi:peroxiredoxin|uniref:thioredoxin family protein n=1 Tax=Candidatus Skiveiella danica TaxID=3386177 RepID=UPI001B4DD9F3|nr:thioredoxin family protein [Comamonadaceae bacterium]MBK8359743.1 thioredoxin family protein [Comamonadaceae bacterium]MBK9988278.1 thioredoxin family protein [Betaproteobacteria bacterium]MBP8101441.1 thioredoxin family protein [Burkholderiaceae bacterium]
MQRRSFLSAAAAAAILMQGHAMAAPAVVGQSAPGFTLTDTAGKPVRLADFKGKTVVLEWNNPGCPFVRKHYQGNMQSLQKEAAAQGVVWLAINSTETASGDYLSPAQLARWMQDKQAVPTATLMDEDGVVGKAYGARVTPHMYIVNAQGVLVYAGGIDSIPSSRVDDIPKATPYIRQALGEIKAGKPLSVSTSQAYGCSVKYKS